MQHVGQSEAEQRPTALEKHRVFGGAKGPEQGGAATAWHLAGIGAGSVLALALLREASKARGGRAEKLRVATAAVAGVTMLDTVLLMRRQRGRLHKPRIVALKASVTIRRPADEVYRFWRELRNLPLFMRHLDSVTELNGHSLWRASGPVGARAEWEAEIVADQPGERIAWRSVEDSKVPNHGSVEFRAAPRGLGTEVHLEIVFEPPGGALGAAIIRLFDEYPEQALKNDLRRLKQLLETGEIVRSDASIHRGKHPARPPTYEERSLVNAMVKS